MMSQLELHPGEGAAGRRARSRSIDAPSPAIQVFCMAVDIAPFDDPHVRAGVPADPRPPGADRRRALRLRHARQRPASARAARTSPTCRSREQDLEQAKSLLAQAGQENLEVTLQTSDIVPGFVEAATLFAQQAKGAGVTVNVKKEAANAYFDTSLLYTKLDFGAVVLDGSARSAPGTSRRCSRTRSGTRRTGATRRSTS